MLPMLTWWCQTASGTSWTDCDRRSSGRTPGPPGPTRYEDGLGRRRIDESDRRRCPAPIREAAAVDPVACIADEAIEHPAVHTCDGLRRMFDAARGKEAFADVVTECLGRARGRVGAHDRSCAYADATVRDVLDMEVGVDFSEIYDDPQSDIWQFSFASGFRATPPDVTAHSSLYEYLPTLRKRGQHGVDFRYVTANSEVLGWIVERATGMPIAELFGEKIYEHLGAEHDAFFVTDPLGKAVAGGGLCVTAPNLLRLALLVSHDGEWNGRRLEPAAVIARLKAGGTPRPSLWGNEDGGTYFSYRSQWYSHDSGRVLYAAGIHGQSIYLSTEHDSAMMLHSSNPDAEGDFFAVGAACFAAITAHLADC